MSQEKKKYVVDYAKEVNAKQFLFRYSNGFVFQKLQNKEIQEKDFQNLQVYRPQNHNLENYFNMLLSDLQSQGAALCKWHYLYFNDRFKRRGKIKKEEKRKNVKRKNRYHTDAINARP